MTVKPNSSTVSGHLRPSAQVIHHINHRLRSAHAHCDPLNALRNAEPYGALENVQDIRPTKSQMRLTRQVDISLWKLLLITLRAQVQLRDENIL